MFFFALSPFGAFLCSFYPDPAFLMVNLCFGLFPPLTGLCQSYQILKFHLNSMSLNGIVIYEEDQIVVLTCNSPMPQLANVMKLKTKMMDVMIFHLVSERQRRIC